MSGINRRIPTSKDILKHPLASVFTYHKFWEAPIGYRWIIFSRLFHASLHRKRMWQAYLGQRGILESSWALLTFWGQRGWTEHGSPTLCYGRNTSFFIHVPQLTLKKTPIWRCLKDPSLIVWSFSHQLQKCTTSHVLSAPEAGRIATCSMGESSSWRRSRKMALEEVLGGSL